MEGGGHFNNYLIAYYITNYKHYETFKRSIKREKTKKDRKVPKYRCFCRLCSITLYYIRNYLILKVYDFLYTYLKKQVFINVICLPIRICPILYYNFTDFFRCLLYNIYELKKTNYISTFFK